MWCWRCFWRPVSPPLPQPVQGPKEQIQTSGETILSISADEVESLSWDYDGQTLSFHRDGAWSYDDDATFPVDAEQMDLLLEPFAAFGAAFIIEDVDDLGQYGWITRCAPSASPPAGRASCWTSARRGFPRGTKKASP